MNEVVDFAVVGFVVAVDAFIFDVQQCYAAFKVELGLLAFGHDVGVGLLGDVEVVVVLGNLSYAEHLRGTEFGESCVDGFGLSQSEIEVLLLQ